MQLDRGGREGREKVRQSKSLQSLTQAAPNPQKVKPR